MASTVADRGAEVNAKPNNAWMYARGVTVTDAKGIPLGCTCLNVVLRESHSMCGTTTRQLMLLGGRGSLAHLRVVACASGNISFPGGPQVAVGTGGIAGGAVLSSGLICVSSMIEVATPLAFVWASLATLLGCFLWDLHVVVLFLV